jgi:hypothetical protein
MGNVRLKSHISSLHITLDFLYGIEPLKYPAATNGPTEQLKISIPTTPLTHFRQYSLAIARILCAFGRTIAVDSGHKF